MPKTIAFTGHRPDKLPGGWDDTDGKQKEMVDWLKKKLAKEARNGRFYIVDGGALGWDQIALEASLKLVGLYSPIMITIVEPHKYFWAKWRPEQIEKYMQLKYSSTDTPRKVVVLHDGGYAAWKMLKRDEWMVNNCDELWAYYDGSPKGGTAFTIEYAKKKGVKIRNLYDEYQREQI